MMMVDGAGRGGGSGGRGGLGTDDLPSELDSSRILAVEDGELSYYEENSQHYDAIGDGDGVEDMHDLPTPVLARPMTSGEGHGAGGGGGSVRVNGGGLGGAGGEVTGAGMMGRGGGVGRAGMLHGGFGSHGSSDCSDGWVDQYTNSSLGVPREELAPGYAQASEAAAAASLQAEQWRKAHLTPAV